MASGDPELVRLYLNRLAASLVPEEVNTSHVQTLVNDLTMHITHQASSMFTYVQPLLQIMNHFRVFFERKNRLNHYQSFYSLVGALVNDTVPEDFTQHLIEMSRLVTELVGVSGQTQSPLMISPFVAPTVSQMEPQMEPQTDSQTELRTTNADLARSFYRTHDERELINTLRHTLVGRNTKLFPFSDHSVEIPETVNLAYTQILSTILEPALLFKTIHSFLEENAGKKTSPIKMAFFSFAQTYLFKYAKHVEDIYRTTPVSLIVLLDSLAEEIQHLLFLNHLKSRIETSGFELLAEVYNLSLFGDPRVSELAKELFKGVSAPYLEYLEHWIIKGELVDEHDEFFVSFDKDENHINDIIKFNEKKVPMFLGVDEGMFFKIFQLGKTLVFLEKYCKEFDWVNDFSSRYYNYIFTTHNGLGSMSPNTLQTMIQRQYEEVIKFNMLVLQSKYSLFSHLLSIKRVMLMESGDFVDATIKDGASMFSQPANSLSSGQLSELLSNSLDLSSLRYLPPNYKNRVDARILDLSHGSMGWDVFTLAYSLPEPPLDAILNYKNQSTQYLRLFNFLWGLKHYQYLLRDCFLCFQDYHRNHLRHVIQRHTPNEPSNKLVLQRLQWLSKSLRVISLIRYKLSSVVDSLLNFVSFDLIENNFNKHVVRKLFKKASFWELVKGSPNEAPRLSILDPSFLGELENESLWVDQNCADLTIDDLTDMHSQYLSSVSECKLLREDVAGKHTGKSLVRQIFEFLEITFTYLASCHEFGTTLKTYVNLLSVKSSSHDLDDNWDDLHRQLESLKSFIQRDIYADKFTAWLKGFTRDMRAEPDLRELGKLI